RVTGELNGFVQSSDPTTINAGNTLRGFDLTVPPTISNTENITRATFGLTAQTKKGFFFGAGVSWNVPSQARDTRFSEDGQDVLSDYYDMQFRIGYHP